MMMKKIIIAVFAKRLIFSYIYCHLVHYSEDQQYRPRKKSTIIWTINFQKKKEEKKNQLNRSRKRKNIKQIVIRFINIKMLKN
jgi:hypothetical protein